MVQARNDEIDISLILKRYGTVNGKLFLLFLFLLQLALYMYYILQIFLQPQPYFKKVSRISTSSIST